MSLARDCSACVTGAHTRHNASEGLTEGLIGGTYCDCTGDCAERRQAEQKEFEKSPLGQMLTAGAKIHTTTEDHMRELS